jgi:hypothetical protein
MENIDALYIKSKTERISLDDYFDDVFRQLKKRFDLTSKEIDEIASYYRDDIETGFIDGYNAKSVVDSFIKDGKLKWKK